MCAQAVAYEMEIRQCGTCLPHEEFYQVRYVGSHYTRVRSSSCVVRSSGEHSPVDTDDVETACSQISWKENSTWLQSLLFTRYYKMFPSGLAI